MEKNSIVTVKEFCERFSHNNEVYVENKDNYRMEFFFNEDNKAGEECIMDWYLPLSELRDCNVIAIKNVMDPDGRIRAITIKIDTDKKVFYALQDRNLLEHYSPLWFCNKVFNEHKEGCCC